MKLRKEIFYKDHKDFKDYKFGYSFPIRVASGVVLLKVGGCCSNIKENKEKLETLGKFALNLEKKEKGGLIYYTYDHEDYDRKYVDEFIKLEDELSKIKKISFEHKVSIHVREIYFAFKKIYFSVVCEQEEFNKDVFEKLEKIGIAYRVYNNSVVVIRGEKNDKA